MGFGGKVAVVTGAGPGLGTTLSRMLADDGATVVALSRTARDIPGATVVTGDVTSIADMRELAETTLATHGRVDVLVNAAFPGTHRIASSVLDDWMAMRAADEGVTFEEIRARGATLDVNGGQLFT